MPPVFGPSSPSKARLKSCAGARATARAPSHTASSETSGPSSSSSMTSGPSNAAAAATRVQLLGRPADEHALARCEPVGLDDARRPSDRQRPGRRPRLPRASPPWRSSSTPRSGRPAPLGPKTDTPPRRSSSATPATSGASGPITTRSAASERARSSSASLSSARTGWQRPCRAILDCPARRATRSARATGRASTPRACSRPPEPTRSTFTARVTAVSGTRCRRSGRAGRARAGARPRERRRSRGPTS